MKNAKNARPFGKRRDQPTKPELPEGWTVDECWFVGGRDNPYEAWFVTTPKGHPDVVFTKRKKP